MLYALVDGEKMTAQPGLRGACPMCDAPMIAKCGRIVAWHWAHENLDDCDPWAEGETNWHLAWKARMPQAEITVVRNGEKHRADAVTANGTVVEFQHSSISGDDIAEREAFYGRMVWVFDAREPYDAERLIICKNTHGYWIDWKWPRKTIVLCKAPVYLDTGGRLVRVTRRFGRPDGRRWGARVGTPDLFVAWATNGRGLA